MKPSLPTWATFVPRFGVSVEANLKLCAELDVRYLELNARQFLANPDPDHGAALRAVWAEAEVTISSVHGPFGLDVSLAAEDDTVRARAVEHWRRLLPSCAAAGARVVVAHPHADRTPPADRPAVAARLLRSLDVLVPVAAEAGVTLAIENLGPGQFGSHEGDLLPLLAAYHSPALGLCFDTGHAFLTRRFAPLCAALMPSAVHYHLSDNDQLADRHLPPPYGMIPWQPFWEQYAAHPVDQPLLLEAAPSAGLTVRDLRELASALVNSCLSSTATPRLGPPGQQALGKDPLTGHYKVWR